MNFFCDFLDCLQSVSLSKLGRDNVVFFFFNLASALAGVTHSTDLKRKKGLQAVQIDFVHGFPCISLESISSYFCQSSIQQYDGQFLIILFTKFTHSANGHTL